MTPDRERFEQLLPFYLNGTLAHEDRAFVQAFVDRHPASAEIVASMAFSRHVQQTVKTLAPQAQPAPDRVNRLLDRWAKSGPIARSIDITSDRTIDRPMVTREPIHDRWLKRLVMAISGVGVAAVTATLVLGISTLPAGLLHADGLDGQPDLRLSLATGIRPDHEAIVAQLQNHNGVIVNQSQQDGRYLIEVDLQNRAASQDGLIQSLQASGHIDGYTLLASR